MLYTPRIDNVENGTVVSRTLRWIGTKWAETANLVVSTTKVKIITSLEVGDSTNLASGVNSAVIGGNGNTASNTNTGIFGGDLNTATGYNSKVLGSAVSAANNDFAVVVAGLANTSAGIASTAIGGISNTVTGQSSANVGGEGVIVTGIRAVSLGGTARTVSKNDVADTLYLDVRNKITQIIDATHEIVDDKFGPFTTTTAGQTTIYTFSPATTTSWSVFVDIDAVDSANSQSRSFRYECKIRRAAGAPVIDGQNVPVGVGNLVATALGIFSVSGNTVIFTVTSGATTPTVVWTGSTKIVSNNAY